jgi:hypothetical protein
MEWIIGLIALVVVMGLASSGGDSKSSRINNAINKLDINNAINKLDKDTRTRRERLSDPNRDRL